MSAKSQRLELRVSPAEKELWAKAAGGSRRVSEWLRSLANAAAQEEPKVSLKGIKIIAPAPVVPPVADGCPRERHHRPGVYCGTCGKVN